MPTAGPLFLVRFSHPSAPNRTVGVGFLVAERHILTCAHVVNLALGRGQRAQEKPSERDGVYLEFPLAEAICRARVEQWVPPPASGTRDGDVAGLVIVGGSVPSGVRPAQLASGAQAGGQVELFGYPGSVVRALRCFQWVT